MTQRVIIFTGDPGDPAPITDLNPLHVQVHEPLNVVVSGGTIVIDPVDLALLAQETTISAIEARTDNLDVLLSTRATEATQLLVKAKTDNLDVALSTRVSEASFLARTPILGQGSMLASAPVVIASNQSAIPVTQSGLWAVDVTQGSAWSVAQSGSWSVSQSGVWVVAVSGTVPISAVALPLPVGAATEATLATRATEATQLLVKAKTDNLDVLLSTRATEATLATRATEATQLLVKTKTDNLDVASSTRLAEATFTTRHPVVGQAAMVASMPVVIASDQAVFPVSLGSSLGKTVVGRTGTLNTTSAAVDQVLLTYTVTAGKTFYLQGFDWSVGRTAFGTATESYGQISLETPSGTKLLTWLARGAAKDFFVEYFDEPIPIPAGTVIRFVVTTIVVTAYTWAANIIGYEK